MIVFSFGLPGPFANWCAQAILRIAQSELGEVDTIAAETLEEFAKGLLSMGALHHVITAHQPSRRFHEAIVEAKAPIILSVCNPRTAVAELVLEHGYDLASALRTVGNSCVATRAAAIARPLILSSFADSALSEAVILQIGRHMGFKPKPAAAAAIAKDLSGLLHERRNTEQWWQALKPEEKAAAQGALDTFVHYQRTRTFGPITWARNLFYIGDEPGEPALRSIDITGRSRCLFYGPYMRLPLGRWKAHFLLAQSEEASGTRFVADIFAGNTPLARETFYSSQAGALTAEVDFEIDEATDTPIDIRFFNDRASFDGRVGLERVVLVPYPAHAMEIGADLAAELGVTAE
jgi:hypothetical protein